MGELFTILYLFLSLVFRNEICVGSFSIREEPQQRWNEIVSGRTVDNFSPASSIEGKN